MQSIQTNTDKIIRELYHVGAIKLGNFQLKNGSTSPIYLDLRQIISSPVLLRFVTEAMWEKVRYTQFNLICGIPYTALPIATCMSLFHNIPMIMRRKEKKYYGTKLAIEGKFEPAQTCLLIEDVITSGSSIMETADDLEAAGLIVRDIIVFIDREENGKASLQKRNYNVQAVLTLTEVLDTLLHASILRKKDHDLIAELLDSRVYQLH